MIKWIAARRFNYIDAVGIGIAATLLLRQEWAIGITVWLLTALVSVSVEIAVERNA